MGRLERYKPRGRNRNTKSRNPLIIIACEGKNKTEENYFKNYNSRKCIIRFSKGNSTDPVGIVNDLIKFINAEVGRESGDKYYAVFDTDVNKNLQSQIDALFLSNRHCLFRKSLFCYLTFIHINCTSICIL